MPKFLSDADLDSIFRAARSHNSWTEEGITDLHIEAIYDLLRWGPTSANCSPARFVFCKSKASREKLADCVSQGNKTKVLTAPLVVIIGQDRRFYDKIPQLFPHNPSARDWFAHDEDMAHETAFRNSTLQGAYLMIAARSLGFDCGPMSGFDKTAVNDAFFRDSDIVANFLCAIGHGREGDLFPRHPRLSFDEACTLL